MKNQNSQSVPKTDKFVRFFLNTLVKHNLKIEFDDPSQVENCVNDIRFLYAQEESIYDLKSNCYRLIYELDVKSKSVVSSGCFVKSFDAIKSDYFEILANNIESLKKCFKQFSVFDVDSDLYLSWKGNDFFDVTNFEGCSYFYHNSGTDYSNRVFFDEEYSNYYDLCSLDSNILNQDYLLYYSSFVMNNELPVKHGFAVTINDDTFNSWKKYYNYDRFQSYIEFLKDNFFNSIISVQLSSLYPELFSFEFQLNVDQYDSIVSKLIEYDCVPDDLKDNLLSVKFPEFIEYFVIKFKWQSSDDFGIKLYAHTENRDAIRSILGVDRF